MLIAIDTATRVMSIALHDGENLLYEQSWQTGNRHTMELAPALRNMLAASDASMDDLIGVGVSTGPGSYTGLRIGVALAKGIAAARNLPLVGMTTLDTLAAGQPYYRGGVGLVAVVAAGRKRIVVQSYHWHKGGWISRAEPRLMAWDELLTTIDGPACITGEIDPTGHHAINHAINQQDAQITVAPASTRLRRAGYLAEYAWERLHHAGGDFSGYTADKLMPVYLNSV